MNRLLLGSLAAGFLVMAFFLGRQSVGPAPSPNSPLRPDKLATALGERDWVERTYGFSEEIRHLNPSNLVEALEVIEDSSAELTRDEKRLLVSAWTRFDPKGAFEFALFGPEKDRRRVAGAVIYAWAQRDPMAARSALLGIQTTELERILEERFVLGWMSGGGLGDAHDYVEGLPPSKRRELLVSQMARALARESAQSTIDWAESVGSDQERFRRTVFNKAAGALAEYHWDRAVAWVESNFGQSHTRGSVRLVALNWAESDPDAAFEWLSSLPNDEEKSEAVGFVFAYWLKSHPEEAAAWLEARDPGEALDPAMRAMAHSKLESNPVLAIDWAHRIHDPGTRERTLVRVGQAWFGKDPNATRRWLEVSDLPKAARKRILETRR